ncbi:MAG: hypothetical protein IH946_06360, partial [Bacteroidetes bacterium]|nr:hypothetical protein [Bacteroidota bacterium]
MKRPVILALSLCISLLLFNPLQATNFYWVGGTGSWSDYNAHWATTSGGSTFHSAVPSTGEDVYFDANSFSSNSTVTLDVSNANFNDMTWSGLSNAITFSGSSSYTLSIYGDLSLDTNMNWNCYGNVFFKSSGSKTIDTKGVNINGYIYLDDVGGTWDLISDLTAEFEYIYHQSGTFNTNGYDVRCRYFNSDNSNSRTLNFGSSNIYLGNYWFSQNITNLNFIPGTSTIIHSGYGMYTGGVTFYDVLFDTQNSLTVTGNNTFNKVTMNGSGTVSFNQNNTFNKLVQESGTVKLLANNTIVDSLIVGKGAHIQLGSNVLQTIGMVSVSG